MAQPSDEIRAKLEQQKQDFMRLAQEALRQKQIQDNLDKMNPPKKADGGSIDAMRLALMSKGGKPLTAKQFYNQYAQHIDLRGRQEGKSAENAKAILEHGFRSGMGTNALPPYAGGEPKNVIASKFKPQHNDMVYLAPKGAWKDTPNGMKIVHGWRPQPHEVINVTDPDQPMYDAYMAGLNKKSKGGLEKFLEHSHVKQRMYHGTGKDFSSFEPNTRGVHFVTPNPDVASLYAGQEYSVESGESPNVMPLYVSAKNPFDYENKKHRDALAVKAALSPNARKKLKEGLWHQLEDRTIMHAIKNMGHDSLYVNEHGAKNLGVFHPHQIKSAIGNRGTYDINDPDITKACGGRVTHAHHLEIEERPL